MRSILHLILFLGLTLLAAGLPDHSRAESTTAILALFEQVTEGKGEAVRLTIEGVPRADLVLLERPNRVALDLFDTVTAVRPALDAESALLGSVRDGLVSQDRYRVIFALSEPAIPAMEVNAEDGRTIIELHFDPASQAAFTAAARQRLADRRVEPAAQTASGRYTVAIDPGHGGADYGAVGRGGTREKDLNLAFGLRLREALASDSVEVVMTREDDRLVPLAERSAIARRAEADLFISLHADSIRYADLRGATVYTLSGTASDALSRELAEGENAADRFLGSEWEQDTPEIHDILVDLVKRETEGLSRRFARDLVVELRAADIRLIKNPVRSAGFRVLMAPDVPSVLVELGYLSNEDDETMMTTPEWQESAAEALAAAVRGFLATRTALPTAR